MNKTVETNVVEEAVAEITEVKEKKEERRLPSAIKLKTADGGGIVLVATTSTSYKKNYLVNYDDAGSRNPSIKKVRFVRLPVSRDGETYRDIWALFEHLTKECKYVRL